jgi:uncharacterized protein YegJ (DUF2314 family)
MLGLAIVAAAFVNANTGTTAGPAQAGTGDPVIEYSDAHAAMNAAQTEAQGGLDMFFSNVLNAEGLPIADAGVKVALPTKDGTDEIIWVSPFGLRDGSFVGVLANEPAGLEGLAIGDVIAFDRAQVRDWYVFGDDGRMYGSYTTRVMLPDMSPETRSQIVEMLSENPIPAGW